MLLKKLFFTAIFSAVPLISFAEKSLCSADEKVIFNCSVKNNDTFVSVCASQKLSDVSGYIQFRFGSTNKIEVIYPTTKSKTQSSFAYEEAQDSDSASDLEILTFKSKGYEYSISRFLNDPDGDAAGMDVTKIKNGTSYLVAKYDCKQPRVKQRMNLKGIVAPASSPS